MRTGLFDGAFDAVLTWMSSLLLGALQHLWSLLAGFALTSPDVTALPQVRSLAEQSLVVADTVYVLALIAAGVIVMTRETIQVRYGVAELAPRLVVGLVAANLALPLCHGAIAAANALTEALTGADIATAGSLGLLQTTITGAVRGLDVSGPQSALLLLLAGLLVVLSLTLALGWVVRLGTLVILVGIAPLALACHALPQTEALARLWWRCLFGALFVVAVQAFALHATLSVFLDPGANLQVLGLPTDAGGTMNLLLIACLLWATTRIPALAARWLSTARPSSLPAIVRVLVVQQLSRGLLRAQPRSAPRPQSGSQPPALSGSAPSAPPRPRF